MAVKKQKPAAKRKAKATVKASKTTKVKAKSKTATKKKAATKTKKSTTRAKAKVATKVKAKSKAKAKPKAKPTAKAKPKAKAKAKKKVKVKVPVVTKKKAVTKEKEKAKETNAPENMPKRTVKVVPAKKTRKPTPLPVEAKVSKTKPATRRKPIARKRAKSNQDFVPYTPRKNEEYMNPAQKDHFRDILQIWKFQLMEEVDRTVNYMQEEAANYPDPADRASQEEEFSLELKTRDRERRLISKIDSTTELIELDDYGYCESCGVEIGIRRLEARPTATLCIDCKTLAEIREKQIRG